MTKWIYVDAILAILLAIGGWDAATKGMYKWAFWLMILAFCEVGLMFGTILRSFYVVR